MVCRVCHCLPVSPATSCFVTSCFFLRLRFQFFCAEFTRLICIKLFEDLSNLKRLRTSRNEQNVRHHWHWLGPFFWIAFNHFFLWKVLKRSQKCLLLVISLGDRAQKRPKSAFEKWKRKVVKCEIGHKSTLQLYISLDLPRACGQGTLTSSIKLTNSSNSNVEYFLTSRRHTKKSPILECSVKPCKFYWNPKHSKSYQISSLKR